METTEKQLDETRSQHTTEVTGKNQDVFVDPRSDFGFKKIFGSKEGEADLIAMLNAFICEEMPSVSNVEYLNTEISGNTAEERKTIFDVYVKDEKNWHYNLEMQDREIKNPLSREFGYICRIHSSSLKPGKQFNYKLDTIVGLFIANFHIIKDPDAPCINLVEFICKKNEHISVPETKLITIELPKFKKELKALEKEKDVYLYLLNNLACLQQIPALLDNEKYGPLFERARIANFNKQEMKNYEAYKKQEENHLLEIEFREEKAKIEGKLEGQLEGKLEGKLNEATKVVENLLKEGVFSLEKIASIVDLPLDQVVQISRRLVTV